MKQDEYEYLLTQILDTMERWAKELEKTSSVKDKRKAIVMNDVIELVKIKKNSAYGEMKEEKPMLNKTFKQEADNILMYWKEREYCIENLGLNKEVYKELITTCEKYTLTRVGDKVEETKDLIVTVINSLNENIIVSLDFVPVSNSIVVQMAFKKYPNFKHTCCFYVIEIEDQFYRGNLEIILKEIIEQFKKNLLDHITGE